MQSILDFILQNWQFLLILLVSLLAILSLYYVFNLRSVDRSKHLEDPSKTQKTIQTSTPEESAPFQHIEPIIVGGEIISNPTRHVDPVEVQPEIQPEPLNAEAPPIDEPSPAPVEPVAPKPKKTLGRYHVLYRAADDAWIVKREGSDRILRTLETQKDAIAYANIKALTNDTQIVIHKKDGKIRKQNYRKGDED
jgi:hypothetical protein